MTHIKKALTSENILTYIAMSMLGKDKNSVMPELLYTFKREEFLKLLAVFGGDKIYIPTPAEFSFYMTCSMAFYYRYSKNAKWVNIRKYLNLDDNKEYEKVKQKTSDWYKSCSKEERETLTNIKEPIIKL